MKAIVSAGGTGGHIYPALAIAAELAARGWELLYMGGRDSLEEVLATQAGLSYAAVSCSPLRLRSRHVAGDMAANYRGVGEARAIVSAFAPQVVIGCGGYASFPVLYAAQRLHIPTLLHEQNAYPGLANRQLAKRADAVCLTFAAAERGFPANAPLHITGLPIRKQILTVERAEALRYFSIEADERPTLLITGGSQGAHSINEAFLPIYDELLLAGIRIVHICGKGNYTQLSQAAPQNPHLILLPYLDNMEYALILADLAVARAGASFLAEAAAIGLPLLLIPYPYAANDHQRHNAAAFKQAGAALVMDSDSLTPANLRRLLLPLLADKRRLRVMGEAARGLAHTAAARQICDIAQSLCK
ncbi:MAG: undecaprenyldiphospho-muramoylpentapeptide beta-N-acetylglucosaminyltransferase [Bacillota bacterium]|nr:undecaprenyldiphospho-muramoylpentapeptide beta-N-acetylglucosaminyltransferase [Bacillota bacterium]